MAEFFKEESSVFEKQLRDVFKPVAENHENDLFKAVALVFYHNEKLSDIYDVYKLFGLENFIKLIHLLDGRVVRMPTSSELKDSIILALCFYYREVDNLTWDEIRTKIPFKFSSLTVSYKIKSLNKVVREELSKLFGIETPVDKDANNG